MRGLKLSMYCVDGRLKKSHPLRMRGLKRIIHSFMASMKLSHPLRMRGLKPYYTMYYSYHEIVASFTDAWIETSFFVN